MIWFYPQGPALYAYNNALFDEDDWKGIRMLCQSIKANDPTKVGYFGMGFKSVFHLTGKSICVMINERYAHVYTLLKIEKRK